MKRVIRLILPYLPYPMVMLLVLGPLMLPGFVLTMDMVFTPHLRMPDHVDNTWLFYTSLHVLNTLLPADFIQKGLLAAILLLSGVGMHRLLAVLRPSSEKALTWALYAGGILYMVNPFVYDRFMAGQYGVLLGYALLPWFAHSLWVFAHRSGWGSAVSVGLWATAMSIASIHSLGWVAILAIGAGAMCINRPQRRTILKYAAVSVIVFAILGAYWQIPAVLGKGRIADSLSTFSDSGRTAFATVDTNGTSTVGAVLGLQGFWQDTRGLYILPIDATPQWGWLQVVFWAVIGVGAVTAWKRQRQYATYATGVVAAALLLSLGIGGEWMAAHVPFFAGFREPQKFAAVIALVYAYWTACGTVWIAGRLRPWLHRAAPAVTLAGLVVLLFAYTSPMLWGFYGQLQLSRYPASWYQMNQALNEQPDHTKALFLPWHLYMSYEFTGNRIIASPAARFFDRTIVASDDPELPGVAPQTHNPIRSEVQQAVLSAGARGELVADKLRALGIGYVIVAKDLDWRTYEWLDRQPGIELFRDASDIRLYKLTNEMVR